MTILIRGARAVLAALVLSPAHAAEFTSTTPLPEPYHVHAMARSGGFIYRVGGLSGLTGLGGARAAHYAPIGADGRLGAWTQGPDMPAAIFGHAAAVHDSTLFVFGGQGFMPPLGLSPSPAVYFTRLAADGSMEGWSATAPLPEAMFFLNAAVWNGRVYVMGGFTGGGLTAGVYSAALTRDGIASWRAEPALPEGVYTHSAVAEDTVYVLGGTINNGADIRNTVYYARIGADGALGPWTQTSSLPRPLGNHSSVVAAGRVFVLGGFDGMAPSAEVLSAPILSDKSLGEWTSYATLPTGRHRHGSAADGKNVYVGGGITSVPLDEVLFAPLPVPPATSLAAKVDYKPETLNLMSNGKTISAHVSFLASQASAADADPASVRIVSANGAAVSIAAETKGASVETEDGVATLKLKFDRAAVQAVLHGGDNTLGLAGRLRDGRAFTGVGTIWAKDKKGPSVAVKPSGKGGHVDLGAKAGFSTVERRGGSVRGGRAAVTLPDGALASPLSVVVVEEPALTAEAVSKRRRAAERGGLTAVGAAVEFGPHGARFDKPVTIELPYDRSRLPASGDESALAVHYWNETAGAWEKLPSEVDRAAGVVRGVTNHFSEYQVMAGAAAASPAAVAVTEVYAYPNPARPGQQPKIRVEGSNASSVDVRIYDVAGALRHSATIPSPVLPLDYLWDMHGAGSGVYVYTVVVHGADGSKARRKGRLAVIR